MLPFRRAKCAEFCYRLYVYGRGLTFVEKFDIFLRETICMLLLPVILLKRLVKKTLRCPGKIGGILLPPDPPESQTSSTPTSGRRSGTQGSQEPKSSFGYKSFQGGRRTERTLISTHLVEAGWARVPGGGAKLGNEPHGQRQRTDAGSSAERITDPYINLEFKAKF